MHESSVTPPVFAGIRSVVVALDMSIKLSSVGTMEGSLVSAGLLEPDPASNTELGRIFEFPRVLSRQPLLLTEVLPLELSLVRGRCGRISSAVYCREALDTNSLSSSSAVNGGGFA